MKGKISLVDFIKEVKNELRAAVDNDDPFFEMGDVELEVTFALDISGKAGVKLVVAELGGETKATQTHKVKITLHPFVESEDSQSTGETVKGMTKPVRYNGKKIQVNTVVTRPHTAPQAKLTQRPLASKSVPKKPTASKPSPTTIKSRPKAG
ncbi:trypco2 family protein [Pseudomonas sp. 1152_12]|uniref:trypco2 family protein n=1 Tax=Pseudomonas sp. 1152_12 TaxID=2604455 RepID=UPI004062DBE9